MTETAKLTNNPIYVHIISFGYLHDTAPEADLTFDLRRHFRDPHVSPELRNMTADDEPVRLAVLNTPGILPLLDAAVASILAVASGPSGDAVAVASGCAGGRHRAPSFARLVGAKLSGMGHYVYLTHRDIGKAVVQR